MKYNVTVERVQRTFLVVEAESAHRAMKDGLAKVNQNEDKFIWDAKEAWAKDVELLDE